MIKPDIPQMDPLRLQTRKHALLNEISSKPSRRWWRFAAPATTMVAAVATTMVLWTPTNPNANASWSAEPRAPGADTEVAVGECREAIEASDRRDEKPPNFPAAPTEVSVVDQRGIMTLALFTGPQSQLLCVNVDGRVGYGGSGRAEGLDQLGDRLFLSYGAGLRSDRDGRNPMRLFSGMVSPKVGKALIETKDGLEVTATIGEGWLLAWWPSKEDATSVTLYDRAGNVLGTEPLPTR